MKSRRLASLTNSTYICCFSNFLIGIYQILFYLNIIHKSNFLQTGVNRRVAAGYTYFATEKHKRSLDIHHGRRRPRIVAQRTCLKSYETCYDAIHENGRETKRTHNKLPP